MEEQQIAQLAEMLQGALNSGDLEGAIQSLQFMDQYDVEIKLTLTAPQQTVYPQPQGQYTVGPGSYQQAQGQYTVGPGSYQQAQGQYTVGPGSYQQVQGQYTVGQSSYQQGGPQSSYQQAQHTVAHGSYSQGGAQAFSQWNDSQQGANDWVFDQTYQRWYNKTTGQYAN